MDLSLEHLNLDPEYLKPHLLEQSHNLLMQPQVQSLLSLLAMQSLLKNQSHPNLTPEQAYYFNRATLVFLKDIREYQPPIVES